MWKARGCLSAKNNVLFLRFQKNASQKGVGEKQIMYSKAYYLQFSKSKSYSDMLQNKQNNMK